MRWGFKKRFSFYSDHFFILISTVLLHFLDWDIPRKWEHNQNVPDTQQEVPLHILASLLPFRHSGTWYIYLFHSSLVSIAFLHIRYAAWICKLKNLTKSMLSSYQMTWKWCQTLSSLNTSFRHGVWTTMTMVQSITSSIYYFCNFVSLRITICWFEDGDSVQAAADQRAADHLPPLLPPAADVLRHHIL